MEPMMKRNIRNTLFSATLIGGLLLPALASAHPGHTEAGYTWFTGLLHPLTGIDHLLMLLIAGLWPFFTGMKHKTLIPTGFLAFMLAGIGLGLLGMSPPLFETVILLCLGATAVMLITGYKLNNKVSMILFAIAGLAHGFAHASAMPLNSNGAEFILGLVTSSAALLLASFLVSQSVVRFKQQSHIAKMPD